MGVAFCAGAEDAAAEGAGAVDEDGLEAGAAAEVVPPTDSFS